MSYLNWLWIFDDERQCLQLSTDDVLLDVSYRRRQLQQYLPEQEAFSMDDVEHFNRFQDYLEQYSSLSVSQQFQACLHATAALHFLKPSLPQSWHFQFADHEPWPEDHLSCALDSGLDCCDMLLLEQDERSSLCLLLDQSMRLSPTKTLNRYECIRVLNDRLQFSRMHPLERPFTRNWSSSA
ncbi:hypothetical protein CWE12_01970 [Aliidiomarina sedimenti]|uniref:Cell division protein ZapC n=1 Tax=Aliidiomarina sedimenti TaxID=1933879 RepID=A0ABY0C215_9GAMM|nr:cell division protein ZapC domain-containing protein [Aliidiomarina sedimenti]RUO31790.1 hypothetical protein CWE12_01970 [Aliidiomarina sedimenti]